MHNLATIRQPFRIRLEQHIPLPTPSHPKQHTHTHYPKVRLVEQKQISSYSTDSGACHTSFRDLQMFPFAPFLSIISGCLRNNRRTAVGRQSESLFLCFIVRGWERRPGEGCQRVWLGIETGFWGATHAILTGSDFDDEWMKDRRFLT